MLVILVTEIIQNVLITASSYSIAQAVHCFCLAVLYKFVVLLFNADKYELNQSLDEALLDKQISIIFNSQDVAYCKQTLLHGH